MQLRNANIDMGGEGLILDLELERTEPDGRKVYRMKGVSHAERGILPGLPASLCAPTFAFRSLPGGADAPAERAKGGDAVEGVASSTSVDWYGTEMDRSALDSMALQFGAGVSLTPRHNGWYNPVEWDEVIGVTEEGTVRAAEVENAAEAKEQGYILSIRAKLFPDEEKAAALQRRISAGQPIGLSIGGWFTDVRFISNDKDEVERIIILEVKLDHLAVTRSPANPDSMGLKLMRSMGEKAVKALRVMPTTPETGRATAPVSPVLVPTAPETRSAPTPTEGKASDKLAPPTPTDDSTSERSAPPTTHEDSMTAEELEAILQRAVAPVTSRLDKLEAARSTEAAPTTAPADSRIAELERTVKARDAQIAELASRGGTSGRRAMIPDHAYDAGNESQFRSMVQLARTEGRAVAISAVSERHEGVLTAELYDPKISRSALEGALRDMINGGISDGIIRDPSEPAWK